MTLKDEGGKDEGGEAGVAIVIKRTCRGEGVEYTPKGGPTICHQGNLGHISSPLCAPLPLLANKSCTGKKMAFTRATTKMSVLPTVTAETTTGLEQPPWGKERRAIG